MHSVNKSHYYQTEKYIGEALPMRLMCCTLARDYLLSIQGTTDDAIIQETLLEIEQSLETSNMVFNDIFMTALASLRNGPIRIITQGEEGSTIHNPIRNMTQQIYGEIPPPCYPEICILNRKAAPMHYNATREIHKRATKRGIQILDPLETNKDKQISLQHTPPRKQCLCFSDKFECLETIPVEKIEQQHNTQTIESEVSEDEPTPNSEDRPRKQQHRQHENTAYLSPTPADTTHRRNQLPLPVSTARSPKSKQSLFTRLIAAEKETLQPKEKEEPEESIERAVPDEPTEQILQQSGTITSNQTEQEENEQPDIPTTTGTSTLNARKRGREIEIYTMANIMKYLTHNNQIQLKAPHETSLKKFPKCQQHNN